MAVSVWRLAHGELGFPPPLAAGIVNVTDDSFFAGARSGTPERAVADGLALVESGFDLLDVGAVAARSGPPVAADDEAGRLVPAIERLVAEAGVPVIADTFSPEVAARALDAGAAAINDIGGGDPEMLALVAERGCGYVLMHIEGPPRVDRAAPHYDDVVGHLSEWFAERLDRAASLGVAPEQIALDPGLDFDLTTDDGIEVVRRLGELRDARPPAVRRAFAQGLPGRDRGRLLGGAARAERPRPGDDGGDGARRRRGRRGAAPARRRRARRDAHRGGDRGVLRRGVRRTKRGPPLLRRLIS